MTSTEYKSVTQKTSNIRCATCFVNRLIKKVGTKDKRISVFPLMITWVVVGEMGIKMTLYIEKLAALQDSTDVPTHFTVNSHVASRELGKLDSRYAGELVFLFIFSSGFDPHHNHTKLFERVDTEAVQTHISWRHWPRKVPRFDVHQFAIPR